MKLQKASLKSILILIMVMIFLSMAVFILLMMNYAKSAEAYKASIYDLKLEKFESAVATRLDNYFTTMEIAALTPMIRENLFRRDVDYAELAELGKDMRRALNSTLHILADEAYVDSYSFFSYLPSDGRYFFPKETMEQQSWYAEFAHADRKADQTFISFAENRYFHAPDKTHNLIILKTINNFNVNTVKKTNDLCYQVVSLNLQGLFGKNFDSAGENAFSVYVFEEQSGKMVYADNSEFIPEAQKACQLASDNRLSRYSNYSEVYRQQKDGPPAAVIRLDEIGANMVLVFSPVSAVPIASSEDFLVGVFVILLFVALTFLLIIFYFSYQKRINVIVHALDSMDETMQPGLLKTPSGKDEIDRIVRHILLMQGRISTLIEEEYKTKLQNISAQYSALTACINPHFLYNTLNSISAMATIEEAQDTDKMVLALRDMFRYSADMSKQMVPLALELKNISDYLYIQGIRYRQLEVKTDVADVFLALTAPKLLLQPIVENCFKHGFRKGQPQNGEKNRIQVSAARTGDTLKISIWDNGVGFTPERLAEINRGLQEKSASGDGKSEIGLLNIHRRLQFLFGEEYGLRIDSVQEMYCRVEISMPYIGEEASQKAE